MLLVYVVYVEADKIHIPAQIPKGAYPETCPNTLNSKFKASSHSTCSAFLNQSQCVRKKREHTHIIITHLTVEDRQHASKCYYASVEQRCVSVHVELCVCAGVSVCVCAGKQHSKKESLCVGR